MEDISWEVWCSNWESGRFNEKLGDSWGNPGRLAGMVYIY